MENTFIVNEIFVANCANQGLGKWYLAMFYYSHRRTTFDSITWDEMFHNICIFIINNLSPFHINWFLYLNKSMNTDSEWNIKRKLKHNFVSRLCKCQDFFDPRYTSAEKPISSFFAEKELIEIHHLLKRTSTRSMRPLHNRQPNKSHWVQLRSLKFQGNYVYL